MCRRPLGIVIGLLLLTGAASAADCSWRGFYVGGNLGIGSARASADYSIRRVPAISGSGSLDGVVYGGQLGYNAQWDPLVLGIDTDIMATSQQASAVRLCASALCGPRVTQTSQDSIPWLGTLRERGGLAFGRVLLLGACGYGYGVFKSTQTLTTLWPLSPRRPQRSGQPG